MTLFVYKKGDSFKCVDLDEARKTESLLKKSGWKLVANIDPIIWIENSLENPDFVKEILEDLVEGMIEVVTGEYEKN